MVDVAEEWGMGAYCVGMAGMSTVRQRLRHPLQATFGLKVANPLGNYRPLLCVSVHFCLSNMDICGSLRSSPCIIPLSATIEQIPTS